MAIKPTALTGLAFDKYQRPSSDTGYQSLQLIPKGRHVKTNFKSCRSSELGQVTDNVTEQHDLARRDGSISWCCAEHKDGKR